MGESAPGSLPSFRGDRIAYRSGAVYTREDNTERFFVSGDAGDDEVVRLGFRWLADYARQHGYARVALVLPGVRNAGYLGRIIGAAAAKRLQTDRRLVTETVMIDMYTETKPPNSFAGPILAVWTRDKALDKLDTTGAPAICAAPSNPDNIADWKASWNPVDVRTGQPSGKDTTISNPVVTKGLEYLTSGVNVGTGLTNPTDRSSAIHLFRLLLEGGESYDSEEIRIWAVRNGWDPSDARELAEVAGNVQQGRALRAEPGGRWRDDALEWLRSEAARDS